MCNEDNKELEKELKEMTEGTAETVEDTIEDVIEEAEEAIEDAIEEAKEEAPQRFIRRTANGFEVDTSEIEKAFAVIGEKISEAINNVQKGVQGSITAAQDRANQRRKADKLAQMLPYLDEAEIHEIAEQILAGDESYKGLDIESLMPFMSKEDCGVLFEKSLEANDKEPGMDGRLYLKCVPYVEEEVLSKLVDRYVEGGFENIRMDNIYPYLSASDVKRIFYYELNK